MFKPSQRLFQVSFLINFLLMLFPLSPPFFSVYLSLSKVLLVSPVGVFYLQVSVWFID